MEFHFEKGSPFLRITVLDKKQSQASKMIKPKREVKAEKWMENRQPKKQKGERRIEITTNQDPKKEAAAKENQRESKGYSGHA